MSYTFTVSPLSAIQTLDIPALQRALGIPTDSIVFSYTYEQAQPFLRSASPDELMRWWEATQDANIGQLGESVHWDEASKVELTRAIYADQDLELFNLLAFIDQFGTAALATDFRTRLRDEWGSDPELTEAARARGFSVRFPQASIAPGFFLPFPANVILEVPDWRGEMNCFGSLPNLARELAEVVALIAAADPSAAIAGQRDAKHEDRLAGACNAARIKLDLAQAGMRENLPFWFSE